MQTAMPTDTKIHACTATWAHAYEGKGLTRCGLSSANMNHAWPRDNTALIGLGLCADCGLIAE